MGNLPEAEPRYSFGEKCTGLFFGFVVHFSGMIVLAESVEGNLPNIQHIPDTAMQTGGIVTGLAFVASGVNIMLGMRES